jgi:hypothetical protein
MLNSTRPVKLFIGRVRYERAAWWAGMFASLVLHTLVVLFWIGDMVQLEEAAPDQRLYSHTTGGRLIRSIRVSSSRREEIPLPPDPIIEVKMPHLDMTEIAAPLPVEHLLSLGLSAWLPSPRSEFGLGPGKLSDIGDSKTEYGYQAPVPKFVAPQWDPPDSARGLEVTVYVLVDEDGWPQDVELDPPTPDDGFNDRIVNQVRGWKYQPARRHGRSTFGWAEITFVF